MSTAIRLIPMASETGFAPLGVLGYCLTRTGFLTPLWQDLALPLKKVDYTSDEKLLAVLVSILTGCRAVAQANTRLRPDVALAQAWGQVRFAEQSTLARTLDAFTPWQVAQLRAGSDSLFRRESRLLHHDFDQGWLWLDIDLTPLPISRQAEASTKGKFAKKTTTAGNWRVSRRRSTTRRCSPASIPARKIVARPICQSWIPWRPLCCSARPRSNARCCAQMRASAATPMSTMR